MVWWRVDPQSGEPEGEYPAPLDSSYVYLDDGAVDAAGDAATEIETSFGASRFMSDVEVQDLLLERVPPASVRRSLRDAEELLQLVDDLWHSVDERYQTALGRPATPKERDLLYRYAYSLLRPKRGGARGEV